MWFKKASPRRLAIREAVEAGAPVRASTGNGYIFLLAAVFFFVACAAQFWPSDPLPYREGELAPTDLSSPITFPIVDEEKTQQNRDFQRQISPPVLVVTKRLSDQVIDGLTNLKLDIGTAQSAAEAPADVKARFPDLNDAAVAAIQGEGTSDYNQRVHETWDAIVTSAPVVTPEDLAALDKYAKGHPYFARVPAATLAQADAAEGLSDATPTIPYDRIVDKSKPAELQSRIAAAVNATNYLPDALHKLATNYVVGILKQKDPMYAYSAKLTEALAGKSAASAALAITKTWEEHEVIVKAGQRITAEKYQVLRAARNAYQAQLQTENPSAIWLSRLGRILMALILTAAGTVYIARMSPVAVQARRLRIAWALCGLLMLTLVMAKVVVALAPQTMYWMGISPTLIAAIILVIAYNQRFALGVSALHGLLVTLTLGQNIDFFLMLLAGVAVFVFGLGEIRTRGKLIEVGVVASAALFATVWAVGLARMGLAWTPWVAVTDLQWVAMQSLWAAAAGVGVAMFALAALPSIERMFRITTSMTLLELCDANKPLLQRLSQEAPGTFNHSLTVGLLAESAGNAIGANGLLCRVGAYYHDVGKLTKPMYFIENQTAGYPNRHDKLSPAMSLLIIVGHVKDGVELAREYALPRVIHQFIGQHHGTTLVEYFYHAAQRRAAQDEARGLGNSGGQAVSETEFRYPGPRPQTREVAIVMICDGCESAVRSLEEPTQGRIETVVHNLVMKRLLDGQFNECDLTLRELSVIEQTLVRSLAGVHHGRIAYPSRMEREDEGETGPISQPA